MPDMHTDIFKLIILRYSQYLVFSIVVVGTADLLELLLILRTRKSV